MTLEADEVGLDTTTDVCTTAGAVTLGADAVTGTVKGVIADAVEETRCSHRDGCAYD